MPKADNTLRFADVPPLIRMTAVSRGEMATLGRAPAKVANEIR
jgi:hypothetical protein